ncbi:MAG: helix-turn-helix domain-containing protein [Planctomycetota bacterium]|nr:helix-turn-helix domain-containing protein [Planctomycetota bacterium]
MIGLQRIEVEGKRFVLLAESEYERLCRESGETADAADDLPPLPSPDDNGRMPAVAYARASIARDLIRARRGAGLSQRQLAESSGVRQETISRLESGKHSASPRTVDRLTTAIDAARKSRKRKGVIRDRRRRV